MKNCNNEYTLSENNNYLLNIKLLFIANYSLPQFYSFHMFNINVFKDFS